MAHKGIDRRRRNYQNRVYPILVLTKRSVPGPIPAGPGRGCPSISSQNPDSSFLVVQIPVNLTGVDTARYSNATARERQSPAADPEQGEPFSLGQYVSIEHCYKLSETTTQWNMAITTSERDGNGLRKWVFDKAMQKLLRDDMGFFMKWIKKGRPKFEPPPNLDTAIRAGVQGVAPLQRAEKRRFGTVSPDPAHPPKRAKNTRSRNCNIL